jgi:raffinose/stachyose/melibiose transport system substrate-binding protein
MNDCTSTSIQKGKHAMTLSRRQFLYGTAGLGAAAAFSSPFLSACSSSSKASGSSKTSDMWWFFNSPQNQQWFEQNIVDPFNVKQGKGPHVSLIGKPQAIGQLQDTALAAGAAPDMMSLGGTNRVDIKYIHDLNDYAKTYAWDSKFLGWAYSNGFQGDKLTTLPAEFNTMVSLYNPATFSKNNWTVPQTKDDFEALCTEAKGQGLMPVAAGSADYAGGIDWFGTIFINHAAGPEAVYEGLTKKIPFTDPVFVDAIALMQSYFQKGWFGGSVSSYFTNHVADLYTKIGNGQAVMQLTGTWAFTEIISYIGPGAKNTETWDWAAIPSLSSAVKPGTFALATGQGIGINAKSKDPDADAAFMNSWFSDPARVAAGLAAVNFPMPPLKFADSDFPASTDPRVKRLYLQIPKATAAGTTGYATWCFFPPKSEAYFQSGLPKVITNAITPAEFCANLTTIFNQEAAAGQVPPLGAPVTA